MIYLDNAATTNYKPQCVIDAVMNCLTKYPFNPNRSGTKQALELQAQLLDARKKLSLLFNNGDENRVIFTSGCTAALNLAIFGTAKRGHIIVTATEHNSVLRCVFQLQKRGFCDVTVVEPNENGEILPDKVEESIRKDTCMLCVSHASNVTGTPQRLYELGVLCRKHDIIFLVDAAQSAGYFPLDMRKCNVDLAAVGSHKGLHGMQGAGALIFSDRVTVRPTVFGGTGTESHLHYQPETLPDALESGTLPTPAIISMSAGVDFWLDNWQKNREIIEIRQKIILDGIKKIKNVTLYSRPNRSGIVAFNVGEYDSGQVADILSEKYDIAVRGGLQCAPFMHKYLGTEDRGVVRASVSCVTTDKECYTLLNAVERISKDKYYSVR